jgi:glucose-1-phosphate cytidylyltransferase
MTDAAGRPIVILAGGRGTRLSEETAYKPMVEVGGRLRRIRPYLGDDALFCMTYGDAVVDIDIAPETGFHRRHGKRATVAAVSPLARFGALHLNGDDTVDRFEEKPSGKGGLISGGFFVLSPSALDLVAGDAMLWEHEPMQTLARTGDLKAYRHEGFWQPMDTLSDLNHPKQLWARRDVARLTQGGTMNPRPDKAGARCPL